jgi:hypothetical protein
MEDDKMPEVRVDLEVVCECGDELEISQRWAGSIKVTPCQKCLEQQYEKGQSDLQKEFDRG